MQKIRVLIVDDSVFMRQLFTEILSGQEDIEVIETAHDPLDAREKIKQHNPDVVTLDIEMPKMDGLSFLEKIMSLRPMPVIMVSTLTQKGAAETLRALEIGAVDCIGKPSSNNPLALERLRVELVEKVRVAATVTCTRAKPLPTSQLPLAFKGNPETALIAIGASTGGVEALREVLVQLPPNAPPILITQHMPEHFTRAFAERLNRITNLNVVEAEHYMKVLPGCVYIAPGNMHLKLGKSGADIICKLSDGELVSGHRPSVDVMFRSVAEMAYKQMVGVLLTGMGKDGAEGLLAMRQAGAYTIGQDKHSCVVYGMPHMAAKLGASMIELPLEQIAAHMLEILRKPFSAAAT